MSLDDLEKAKPASGIDFKEYVVDPVLSDRKNGGLFGFRFDYDMTDAFIEQAESLDSGA